MFLSLAKEINAEIFQFELKMKDIVLHKKRVEERIADIFGHRVPTWQDVLSREYEEWDENRDGYDTVIWMDNSAEAFAMCLEVLRNIEVCQEYKSFSS